MVLLRHLLGDALRRLRLRQGRTLREVSASARVSLGYLSEVERGQKEASSELLAAICSALGAPLSQVLREVSDNFALAELQSEPVFAAVIEPPIEVTGVSHGTGHDADQVAQEEFPAVPVASERVSLPAEQRVPAGAGSRVPAAAGQFGHGQLGHGALGHSISTGHGQIPAPQVAGPIGARPISAGQLGQGQKLTVPGRMPIGANLAIGEPAFDQVTRTVREITKMVPV
jgi:transcriptional regulator with XRE-family HTH domain